jgi:hypothetical protein
LWIPTCAGMTVLRFLWIPACAGMTVSHLQKRKTLKTTLMSINKFKQRIQTEPGWKYLSLDRIEKALQLPPQAESWSCGPNSGYRALILNGDKSSENGLRSFIDKCPKSVGAPQTTGGKVVDLIMTSGRFTPAAKLANKVANQFDRSIDVGPDPSSLANYINKHSKSKVQRYSLQEENWSDFWTQLCRDIDRAAPAIILLEYGTIKLHYINLIGYNPNNETVAILDTDNAIEFWSKSKFQHQAKITVRYIRGTWNAVRFDC